MHLKHNYLICSQTSSSSTIIYWNNHLEVEELKFPQVWSLVIHTCKGDANSAGSTLRLLPCVWIAPLLSSPTLPYLILAAVRTSKVSLWSPCQPVLAQDRDGRKHFQILSLLVHLFLWPSHLKNSVGAYTHLPSLWIKVLENQPGVHTVTPCVS